jgi:hypothetical protein
MSHGPNEDNDIVDDDDQHVHKKHPKPPRMPLPHQHGSSHSINKAHWEMVAQHIMRYISPCFI